MYKDISRIEEMVSMYLVLDEEDQLEIQEKLWPWPIVRARRPLPPW